MCINLCMKLLITSGDEDTGPVGTEALGCLHASGTDSPGIVSSLAWQCSPASMLAMPVAKVQGAVSRF